MNFQLDPRLAQDTVLLGDFPLCRILLMNNAHFPWLIAVPTQNDLVEIIDLSIEDQHVLMGEISYVSEIVEKVFNPDKLNIAALGNQISQLHIHIIARYEDDIAWPEPVWGKEVEPYTEVALEKTQSILIEALLGD